MKKLLVWKDTEPRVVGRNSVIGAFAMWAVRQSPYLQPEGLDRGISEFDAAFKCEEFERMTIEDLGQRVFAAIEASPQIVAWNSPKIGNAAFGIVSRYHTPKPDYDFIDLNAFARNIKYSIWLEILYDDNYFEGAAKGKEGAA